MELRNHKEDKNIIEEVARGSIAEELEIVPGDILLSINDIAVTDIIDYKYLVSDDYVLVAIEKPDGEIWEFEIEKDFDEDLGIIFTNPLIDKAKSCRNNCIFCFIDQLPPNMRETLYFKDDDSRLSFLQGNFITLTNMSDEEVDRIIKYRISPINVSVHTTNPELRIQMLNNKNAGKVYDILKRFAEARLEVNCQIVLVPGVNDGNELDRTLEDLSKLYPTVESVAVVPIGITKYREKLHKVIPYTAALSNELLDFIEEKQNKFIEELGTRFIFASDEFFALTQRKLPSQNEYEGFPQLENGVGLMKSFGTEIFEEIDKIISPIEKKKKYILATGTLANNFMVEMKDKIVEKFDELELLVVPIVNKFFGQTITVSGLITGQDLIQQLREYKDVDRIIIPRSMMKADEEIFLDNLTLEEVTKELGVPIIPSKVDGKTFIDIIKN
jgi:putative radical SAM enzyme (TIGR03279 family)